MALQAILFVMAIVTAVVLHKFFPEETRRAVRILDMSRTAVFFVGAVLFALVFIGSGNEYLVMVGFIILVFIATKAMFDYDRNDVRRVIRKVR